MFQRPQNPGLTTSDSIRVTLHLGCHRWVFSYQHGDEWTIMRRISQLGRSPSGDFGVAVARIICRHIARIHSDWSDQSDHEAS